MSLRFAEKPGYQRRRRFALGLAALLAVLIGSAIEAVADDTASRSITINRGESFVIKESSPSTPPQIQPIDNPHALVVNQQADGGVLVLGAEAGAETVQVTTIDGKVETYTVTVRALSNPDKPLDPGAAPVAAEALDRGSGPVGAPGSGSVAEPAASANSPAPEAPAAGVPPAPASEYEQPQSSPSAAKDGGEAGAAPGPLGLSPTVISAQPPQKFATNPPATGGGDESAHGPDNLPDDTIAIRSGSSRLFNFARRIKRVSIADSEIADLQVIDPHQLMLIGHKPGFTSLAVWDDQGHYEQRQVRIAQSGPEQVMLKVLVAEVDRSRLENQGLDYSAGLTHYGLSLSALPGQVATPYASSSVISGTAGANPGLLPAGGSIIPLLLSNGLTYALSAQNADVQAQSLFRFLEEHSLARILAEPQLMANSGEEAKFLSGGEIPIVIAQALNTSIVFKQFGTSVAFIPTVVGKSRIELLVKPEVSKPDFTQGVSLFGFTVPAFVTQRAETVVQMNEAQTLIIAGLILRNRRQVVNKVPYLGDVPFAGGLFRNTTYQDTKTELVMSVTPRIVRPIPADAEVVYPTTGPPTREELRTERVSPPDASRPRF